jgi:hypothetical protein
MKDTLIELLGLSNNAFALNILHGVEESIVASLSSHWSLPSQSHLFMQSLLTRVTTKPILLIDPQTLAR